MPMNNFLQTLVTKFSEWWCNDSSTGLLNDNLGFSTLIKYSAGGTHLDCLPMLIALHGDGDTVDSFYESALSQLNVPARIILIQAPISHEMGNVWPFSAEQYAEYGEIFSEAVNSLAKQYPTLNKPVLFGFSGGGAMAYYQAVKHGDSYSYIFPISGLLYKEQLGAGSSKPSASVYTYHGKNDEVVAFSAGKNAIKLLKKNKVNVSLTEFEGGHHGLFAEMKTPITQDLEQKLNNL